MKKGTLVRILLSGHAGILRVLESRNYVEGTLVLLEYVEPLRLAGSRTSMYSDGLVPLSPLEHLAREGR
jgi:hypothetical protein